MILKSLSRKSNSTGQLVSYVMRYIFKEQEGPLIKTEMAKVKQQNQKFIIRHNLRARTSLKSFTNEFQENEAFRLVKRKDSVRLYHTIISFSNKDKQHITNDLLRDMANKFIEERGTNNLYLGTKHEEGIDHVHLHFIISGTQLNGRSSRVSKQKFHSIKLALDRYQQEKYPQLVYSLPEHGKSKRLIKESLLKQIKASHQTNKQTLVESLDKIYDQSVSREDFSKQMVKIGAQVYYRRGRLQGVIFNEKKFRFNRLGFDDKRLEDLDTPKQTIENPLLQLQQIREKKLRQIKREIDKPQMKQEAQLNNEQDNLLSELSAIRSSKENRLLEKDNYDEREKNLIVETETAEDITPDLNLGFPTLFDELKFLKPRHKLEI